VPCVDGWEKGNVPTSGARAECPYCGAESLLVVKKDDVSRWHCTGCDLTWRSRGSIPLCDVCDGLKVIAGTTATMSGQPDDTGGERTGHAQARSSWQCPACAR
jgi:ribosomal protein S27AE